MNKKEEECPQNTAAKRSEGGGGSLEEVWATQAIPLQSWPGKDSRGRKEEGRRPPCHDAPI